MTGTWLVLVEHGKIDCPEHLKPYLDYVGIGAEFYNNCGGAYTLDGYVVRKEHLSDHSQVPELGAMKIGMKCSV